MYLKFRALGKDGIWRYGRYPHLAPEMSNTIFSMVTFWELVANRDVRRETISQYIGLKDKHNTERYYGDIFRASEVNPVLSMVCWDNENAKFRLKDIPEMEWSKSELLWVLKYHNYVGNIYENPELLKK
jgi:hypothetical protein